jgi:hypothetical protein
MASGPDLGLDGPKWAVAPARDGGAGGDVSGVAAVLVMPPSMGVLLQAHAGQW